MALRNPLTKSGPISPKAHGAWLGAGSGIAVANIIVGLIQTYWIHKALPGAAVQAIDAVCTAGVAFIGSWLAPLIAKSFPGAVVAPTGYAATSVAGGGVTTVTINPATKNPT